MRFRPRDHERFIGGYDPEHEMPDPDRRPRGPWQSEAYRDQARDSRYMYRWNPDRFESRLDDWRRREREDDFIQSRERYAPYGLTRGYDRARYLERDRDFDRDLDRGYGYDREPMPRRFFNDRDYDDYRYRGGDPWSRHDRYEREHFRDDYSDQGYWDRDRPYNRGGRY
jgi:hypothetical protein